MFLVVIFPRSGNSSTWDYTLSNFMATLKTESCDVFFHIFRGRTGVGHLGHLGMKHRSLAVWLAISIIHGPDRHGFPRIAKTTSRDWSSNIYSLLGNA